MPQRGCRTHWLSRRVWSVCAVACAWQACAAFAETPAVAGTQPLLLAAAAPSPVEPFAPPYRRGIEVQQPPADGAAVLRVAVPVAVPDESQTGDVVQPPADIPATIPADAKAGAAADARADFQAEARAESAPQPAGNTGLLGLHSAIEFGVMAANRQPLEASNAAFHEQVRRIAGNLQAAARTLYPDQMKRLGAFDVYVGDAANCATMSSGTGKVAINAGFSKLGPADDWLAFVVAREMGHVLAGHHDNNSGASLAVSVLMNFIVPGSGVIKSVISFASSQIAAETGHDRQVKEADEVAMKLLEGAGYTRKSVALNLRLAPLAADVDTSWAKDFRASALRLTGAPPAPAADTATAAAGLAGTLQNAGVAQTAVPLAAAPAANWRPDDLVRTRPSGLPGPLYVGGYAVPSRYVE